MPDSPPKPSAEHPDAALLTAFSQGLLDEPRAQQLIDHLEDCQLCVQRLDQLPIEPHSLETLLRQAPEQAALPTLRPEGVGSAGGIQPELPFIEGYEIRAELGRGAMGIVYRALDQQLNREVALKVMMLGVDADREHYWRLRREAETIAGLRHDGIVQIHAVGESGGWFYMALELLEPGGLESILDPAPAEPLWSAALMAGIADIVACAHANGIVHRDLKPENILLQTDAGAEADSDTELSHDGRPTLAALPAVKLTDFGIAKAMSEDVGLTRTGLVMGTPQYMAPEQLHADPGSVGPAADVYALGALLYRLLCGQPPLMADDVMSLMQQVRDREPPTLAERGVNLPKDLDAIVSHCLQKDPAARYQNAGELAADLLAFTRGETVQARPPTPWQRLRRWSRRKPLLASIYLAMPTIGLFHLLVVMRWVEGRSTMMAFDWLVLGAMASAMLFTARIQKLLESPRTHAGEGYLIVVFACVMLGLVLSLDQGLQSPQRQMYQTIIPMTLLLRPSLSLIAFSTLTSICSYLGVTLFIQLQRPELAVSGEETAFFTLSLLVMGFIMMMLRRQIRYTG